MERFAAMMICVFAFCCASMADAQQNKIDDIIQKNLLLEKNGQYREAYVEWQRLLVNPEFGGKNLANPDVQKIFYPCYFYYTRTCYKMAVLDPKIKNRQKFIDAAAGMIIKLETSKLKEGWKIAGPMYEELLKENDSEELKKAYDKLKWEREIKNLLDP